VRGSKTCGFRESFERTGQGRSTHACSTPTYCRQPVSHRLESNLLAAQPCRRQSSALPSRSGANMRSKMHGSEAGTTISESVRQSRARTVSPATRAPLQHQPPPGGAQVPAGPATQVTSCCCTTSLPPGWPPRFVAGLRPCALACPFRVGGAGGPQDLEGRPNPLQVLLRVRAREVPRRHLARVRAHVGRWSWAVWAVLLSGYRPPPCATCSTTAAGCPPTRSQNLRVLWRHGPLRSATPVRGRSSVAWPRPRLKSGWPRLPGRGGRTRRTLTYFG
jgi:hypothetical protein